MAAATSNDYPGSGEANKMVKKNLMKPSMKARIIVKDIAKNKMSFEMNKKIKTESYVPISEKEQLSQLLSILKQTVRDNIPYFKTE